MSKRHKLLLWTMVCFGYLSLNFSSYGPSLIVYFLDVGQGDATLIVSPSGRLILVDGGPHQTVVSELDSVMPFWQRHVDLVMVSHPDDDHISGLVSVLDRYSVSRLLQSNRQKDSPSNKALQRLITKYEVADSGFYRGDTIELDGLLIRGWWPDPTKAEGWTGDANAMSQVVSLEYGPFAMLLTGDAEEVELSQALSGWQEQAAVLKVPHHGSAGGLNEELLKKLRVQVAVISSGVDNRYGHPSQQILQLLSNNDTQTLRTDSHGTVKVVVNKAGFSIYTEK